jgi:hypothetical protein
VACSRVRELQEDSPPSPSFWKSAAPTPASRRSKRWDRLRAGLDLILDQRRADMAEVPAARAGMLGRGHKGKEADRLVIRIDPGVVALAAELRGHERQAAEGLGQWTRVEGRKTASPARDQTGRAPW